MASSIVDLGDLPMEILEKIVSQLSREEICTKIRLVSHKFEEVSYNVMCCEIRAVEPIIDKQLEAARSELQQIVVTADTLENEMILVAQFTFLQIMYSEYRVLSTIFFERNSITQSSIIFKSCRNLNEFYRLLNGSALNQWDWRAGNVSTAMDKLRSLNSEICDEFFWKIWNIIQDPFGPIFLKLLGCSICSKCKVAVSHEAKPKFRDSKCHLSGQYEIMDVSNTLTSPPGGSQDPHHGLRMLAAYVCDAVRWGNLFHTLRLRWVCMDRALALGRRQRPGWPLIDPLDPYVNTSFQIISETEQELRNNEVKVCRIVTKSGEDSSQVPSWLGMRSEFQLWCPISDVPREMFKLGELDEYKELPEGAAPSLRPYRFKLEFRTYVRALSPRSSGIIETTVWIEETPENIAFTQSKQMFR